MSALTAKATSRQANTPEQCGVLNNQRAKVLSNTACPSCFRKATVEVSIHKHGALTFCYSCGHRETSFY